MRGLGDLLRALEARPIGVSLHFAVAAGLVAYGMCLALASRDLRLIAAW